MKRIAVLGSTGSIGEQTLDVARRLPDQLRVVALAAGTNVSRLAAQSVELAVRSCALSDKSLRPQFEEALRGADGIEPLYGEDAMTAIATRADVDIVVVAVSGFVGARATIAALEAGKTVALATKEILVAAGRVVMEASRRGGAAIIPIDSEHSALFQCMRGEPAPNVARLWLTASGGPFRGYSAERMARATPEEALNHPTWRMGKKVTIDSATMMNKGLETIEAHWMFGVPVDCIEVVVHPQSIVHSIVETVDGALLAQLGQPDMRLPIEYALLHPERADMGPDVPRLDPRRMGELTFEAPNEALFPCLGLARRAARTGGTMPAVLNGANERAVEKFLNGQIPFGGISRSIEAALDAHEARLGDGCELHQILIADRWARDFVTTATND